MGGRSAGNQQERTWRIEHVPALDGLRGLAVAAVLLYHHGTPWARGGFLGVSLFFTLSGFLITSLLVTEREATGSIGLGGFWSRRARRLVPAGLLGIALALAVTPVVVPPAQQAATALDIRYALTQLTNWRFIWADAPYAEVGVVPSPVLHYWSLAVEEQLYLLLPFIAILGLRRGRGAVAGALLALVGLSLWRQIVIDHGDRVYFGTDTRAAEVAVGGLLALGWLVLRERGLLDLTAARRLCDGIGVVALGGTAILWMRAEQSSPALLGGGLVAVGCLSTAVLVGALAGPHVGRVLSAAPLRSLGRISYGVYVVHFPIFLLLSPERSGLDGPALLAARVVMTLALATASYVVLERPVRAGVALPRLVGAVPVVVVAALGLGTLVVPGLADRTQPASSAGPVVVAAPAPSTLAPVVSGAAAPPGDAVSGSEPDAGAPVEPVDPPEVPSTAPPGTDAGPAPTPARPARVVVLGDSTALGNGVGLQRWGERTGHLAVSVVGRNGCAVLQGERLRIAEGYEVSPEPCADVFGSAVEEAARISADALVVFIGSSQLGDWRYPGDDRWRAITEPEITVRYREALGSTLDLLATAGVPVLWADVPTPAWDLDRFFGGRVVDADEPVLNDAARAATLNELTTPLVSARPGMVVLGYAAGLAGSDGEIGYDERADGLHLDDEQVQEAADRWLVRAIAEAHAAAMTALGREQTEPLSWHQAG